MRMEVFKSLGFDFKDEGELAKVIKKINNEIQMDYLNMCNIDNAEIIASYEEGYLYQFGLFYPSEQFTDVYEFGQDEDKDGHYIMTARDNDGNLYEFYPYHPSLRDEDYSFEALKLQYLFIPKNIRYYTSTKDYLDREEAEFNEFLVPADSYRDLFNKDTMAVYYLNTRILSVEENYNEVTRKKFYGLRLKYLDNIVTTVLTEEQIGCVPKAGALLTGEFYLTGKLFNKFKGYREFKGYLIKNEEFSNIHNILDLYNACYKAYDFDTTYHGCSSYFKMSNRTLGQCCITAMLVHELTGADIYLYNDGTYEHYFNMLNGRVLDLCSESIEIWFDEWNYSTGKCIPFSSFTSDSLFKRYNLLKTRVKKYEAKLMPQTNFYNAIGFNMTGSYHDDLETIYGKVEFERKIKVNKNYDIVIKENVAYYDSGIPSVFYYLENGIYYDYAPFYSANNFFELNEVEAVKRDEDEKIPSFIVGKTNDGGLFKAFNIGFLKHHKFLKRMKYKVEACFLADDVELFSDKDSFNEVYPDMTAHQFKSFTELDREWKHSSEGRFYIGGYIKGVEGFTNEYTNQDYYLIRLMHKGRIMEVLVGEEQINKKPRIGNVLVGHFYTTAKIMPLFEGYKEFKDRVIEKSTNPHLRTVLDLYRALYQSYSIDTAYPGSRPWWRSVDRTLGQCAIVSMLVYDLLGGEIMIYENPRGQHYFNIIDGRVLDLTTEQYDIELDDIDYSKARVCKRESFKSENCLERYERLIDNLKKYLNSLEEVKHD